jgi:hypothetical protein
VGAEPLPNQTSPYHVPGVRFRVLEADKVTRPRQALGLGSPIAGSSRTAGVFEYSVRLLHGVYPVRTCSKREAGRHVDARPRESVSVQDHGVIASFQSSASWSG